MSSVDERVVQMKFENAAFQSGVQQTIASLTQLNKSLQLQGGTKGLAGVSVSVENFNKHMVQGRDSAGRFTESVSQSSTVASSFSQKIEQSQGALGKMVSGISSLVSHFTNFGQKVDTGRNSLGQFSSGLDQTAGSSGTTSSALQRLENGVSAIGNRFSALNTIATGALLNIGARAGQAAQQMLSSFSFAPIMDGFHEYETNLNSVQTILANTQAAGTNLKQVNATLDELNHYSDETIYNFSEMAKNIGTFTAAGVGLKESAAAIKGIANLAALSGSNSEQASGAMYQLSQAISAGRVSLEDWNSVVNAGMGGTVFQRALAMNAEKMGTLDKGAVKLKGSMKNVTIEGKSFRESITAKPGQESWLTSKVLTQTLAQFTGDLSDAQLKAQGFSKAQIKAIQDQAKMAKAAATEVKTMTQLMGTLKESLGSGWTETWQLIFGDFTEAKGLFTGVSNTLGGFVTASSNARNKVLGDWKALGGRTVLIDSISLAFNALIAVIKPIKDAFREIFPATTGKQLYDFTVIIHRIAENLLISGETADRVKRTFAGLFAILGIGWEIVKAVAKTLFDLFGVATKGGGGILKLTANIGDFLVGLHKAIADGDDLTKFFGKFGAILALPIKLIQTLASHLGKLFGGVKGSGSDAAKSVTSFADRLRPLGAIMDAIARGGNGLISALDSVLTKMGPWVRKVGDFFKGLGMAIAGSFGGMDFKTVLAGINTGLFAGLVLLIKSFISKLKSGQEIGGGIIDAITSPFEQLTKTLSAMQHTLQATTLMLIAIAIGVLAASVMVLSKIDSEGLTRALTAMTIMFTQLFASMAIFQKVVGSGGFAQMPLITGAMILLAIAIDILASAVKKLGALPWQELAKGLYGVLVLMAGLVTAVKFMPPSSGLISTGLGLIVLAGAIRILVESVTALSGLSWKELAKGLVAVGVLLGSLTLFTMFAKANAGAVAQGAGIILLAVGIKILASALKDLAQMSWKDIGKGLAAMGGGLLLIAAALYAIPPTALLSAAGVIVVAASLSLISDAMKSMATMSWKDIGKGLTVMVGALTLIAAALWAIPPTALLSAAGVIVVAASLQLITDALKDMATMNWKDIGKSMVVLAGSLGIIAIAMLAMLPALPGAAALVVVVAALALLLPVLMAFGSMSWTEMGKGLLMLAGIFLVLGAAGLVLAALTPVLLALGAAILLLGAGVLLAGAGVFLFATALTALAVAGTAGAAAMTAIVAGLVGLIPMVMEQIGLGLIAFAKAISTAGPAITKALVVVLLALIDAINKLIPPIINTMYKLLSALVAAMLKYVPNMVSMGIKLITGVLNGIAQNIGGMITAATNVVVAFLSGLSKNQPRMLKAGADYIISFINALATTIRSSSKALGEAGANLSTAIVEGMIRGLAAGAGKIAEKAGSVAKGALTSAMHVLGIHSPSKEFEKIGNYVNDGFKKGLDGNKSQIDTAFNTLKSQLLALSKSAKATGSERKKAAAAYSTLTKSLADEHSSLGKLATDYDTYTTKIKNAQQALTDIKKTRDDFKKSVTDQYSVLPSVSADTKIVDYKADLKTQIEKTKQFSNTLQRLRALGLNDEAYKELLSKGVDALPFANQLLDGGRDSVNEINKLDSELATAAKALGNSASSALYDAAVRSAEGLVKGLQGQQGVLEHLMDSIADTMIKSLKKKLGIKSPSREFAKIGGHSAQGLINGLGEMSGSVQKAATSTGEAAVTALQKSLTGFSDLITSDVSLNPVITPVLDLSSVKKDARQIGSILPGQSVSVGSSYAKARSISSDRMSTAQEIDTPVVEAPAVALNYVQNNYSPKALTKAEIYRNTKNQLSQAKGALATSANQSRG